jgi:hypothetical protein
MEPNMEILMKKELEDRILRLRSKIFYLGTLFGFFASRKDQAIGKTTIEELSVVLGRRFKVVKGNSRTYGADTVAFSFSYQQTSRSKSYVYWMTLICSNNGSDIENTVLQEIQRSVQALEVQIESLNQNLSNLDLFLEIQENIRNEKARLQELQYTNLEQLEEYILDDLSPRRQGRVHTGENKFPLWDQSE